MKLTTPYIIGIISFVILIPATIIIVKIKSDKSNDSPLSSPSPSHSRNINYNTKPLAFAQKNNKPKIKKYNLPRTQYKLGHINVPEHYNSNQCYDGFTPKLSSYYNKPTVMRPVPTMNANYGLEPTPDDCPCVEFVLPP